MRSKRSTALGFATGLALAGATTAIAQVQAYANTNGVMFGYTVQKNGQTVCHNPTVYVQFRGPQSYIVCE